MARTKTSKTTVVGHEIGPDEHDPNQINDFQTLQDAAYANQQRIFKLARDRHAAMQKSDEDTAQKYTERIKQRQRLATRFIQRREELKEKVRLAALDEQRRAYQPTEDQIIDNLKQIRGHLEKLQSQVATLRQKASRSQKSYTKSRDLLAYQRIIDATVEMLSRAPGIAE